jgi:hypothetical protein
MRKHGRVPKSDTSPDECCPALVTGDVVIGDQG